MIQAISLNTPINQSNNTKIKSSEGRLITSLYLPRINKDTVSFRGKVEFLPFYEFISKVLGTLSHEGNKKLEEATNKLLKDKPSTDDLAETAKANFADILALFKKLGIETQRDEKGLKVAYDKQQLDQNTRKQIEESYMKSLMGRKITAYLNGSSSLMDNAAYRDWFPSVSFNSKLPNLHHTRFVHPVTKAKSLVPDSTQQEESIIAANVSRLRQKNPDPKSLENKKERALKNIMNIFNSADFLANGYPTNFQLKKLRANVMAYQIYEQALGSNKKFSTAVETVALSATKKLSEANVGDFIDDLGLVIQKTTIHDCEKRQDVPCLVVFNKEKLDSSLLLLKIDEEYEKKLTDFEARYRKIKESSDADKANDEIPSLENEARTIINTEQELKIAQVYFNIVPVEHLRDCLKDIDKPQIVESLIDTISQKTKQATLIVDFINSDAKRYYDGGRKVVLPLIQLLQEHNCVDIVIKALAIGEKSKSPVPLYLRAGFKPLSHTEKELREAIVNGGWDSKIPVYMYLPHDAIVHQVVNKQKPLQEIFAK